MASPLFATPYASAHSPAASMGSKRKRDFGDESDSMGMGGSPRGVLQPGSGRTMKRWRNGRPLEEDVYQYTLQKLFSAQSQNVQPPPPAAHQAAQFTHSQSRPHPAAASPTLKNASLTRGPSLPRTTNTNPFAAMGHTKPAAGAGLFKFMCTGAGAAPAHTSIGHVDEVIMDGIGEAAVCEDCDRRMELAGFGGTRKGAVWGVRGGCARLVAVSREGTGEGLVWTVL